MEEGYTFGAAECGADGMYETTPGKVRGFCGLVVLLSKYNIIYHHIIHSYCVSRFRPPPPTPCLQSVLHEGDELELYVPALHRSARDGGRVLAHVHTAEQAGALRR